MDNRGHITQTKGPDTVEPLIEYEDLTGYHGEAEDTDYRPSREQLEYEERIRQRIRERRRAAERRRVRRNRTVALILLIVIVLIIFKACSSGKSGGKKNKEEKSSSSAAEAADRNVSDAPMESEESAESSSEAEAAGHKLETIDGMTFVDNILIVNKTYSLPSDYAPGVSDEAQAAFDQMASDAMNDGIYLFINSGYRSYWDQAELYNSYASERGTDEADRVSSRPGHSEHQTGLAFDVNTTEFSFEGTPEAIWLEQHCAEYGFIIRFPKGKEAMTGYEYEPWHIRYLGVDKATAVTNSGLCLEEYLGVTSDYQYATDQEESSEISYDTGYAEGNSYDGDGAYVGTYDDNDYGDTGDGGTGDWATDYGYYN